MKFWLMALGLFPLAGLTGCASILDGSTETVAVRTTAGDAALPSAQCALANKKGSWNVMTPGSVMVHRGSEALQVSCTKDGYAGGTEMVQSATNNDVYWNIALGGGIGAASDTIDGAAWKYPKVITVPMVATAGGPVAAAN